MRKFKDINVRKYDNLHTARIKKKTGKFRFFFSKVTKLFSKIVNWGFNKLEMGEYTTKNPLLHK